MVRLLKRPRGETILIGGALAAAVFVAFGPNTWVGMMARSFLPQWMLAFTCWGAWIAWRGFGRCATAMLGCTILLATQLPGGADAVNAPVALRIAHFNVLQSNRSYAAVLERILSCDADLVSVQEVDPAWAAGLRAALADRYPYRIIEPRANCYGIALLSRIPLKNARVLMLGDTPAIEATARTMSGEVRVFAVHTTSPGSPGHFMARNRQYARLADEVRRSSSAVLVIGDLNAAPWDRDLIRFRARTGLRSNAHLTGPTFPSVAHLALIPIDHVLTSAGVHVVAERTVHLPGSDHRGLVAEIALGT